MPCLGVASKGQGELEIRAASVIEIFREAGGPGVGQAVKVR